MLQPWPNFDGQETDTEAEAEIAWLQSIIVAIRTIRSESNLGPSKELDVLVANTTAVDIERMQNNAQALRKLAKVATIQPLAAGSEPPPALSALCQHLEVMVPMAGVIDIEAELKRIDKDVDKQAQEIKRLEGKLSNPKFVDKAPEAVVEAERIKLAAAMDALSKLQSQRARMEGLL